MDDQAVKALLQSQLADCEIEVNGDGRHFDVLVIGDVFEGLSPVKRQQLVYAALNQEIADGSIHAVNMKTYTRAQWQQQQSR